MKVLLAVGGGGHFSPALAVIEQMPKEWEVLLVGRKYAFEGDQALSFEYTTATRLGLPFEPVTTGRLQRKITLRTFSSLAKMPVGLVQAKEIINRFKPDVVLSFGGYVSVPVVLASALMRVPIVIHEQTLHAGLANKIAAKFAAKICISWEASRKFFPSDKTLMTGNPLRKEFLMRDQGRGTGKHEGSLPLIYVTGGSGGAHGINVLIEGCLERLLEKCVVIHQTGDAKEFGDFARLDQLRMTLPTNIQNRYEVRKFTEPEKVLAVLQRADLVIARSGINTVTELLYLGKPCLFIPLPFGQHNEQLTNAEFVKNLGLAEILDQLQTAPDDLLQKIETMVTNLDSYKKNQDTARALIHTDAAAKIIKEVQYAKEKRSAS